MLVSKYSYIKVYVSMIEIDVYNLKFDLECPTACLIKKMLAAK